MSFDNSTVKEISLVPDYKALEIIMANRNELKSFKASGEPILVDICKQPDYLNFQKCLNDSVDYLCKRKKRANVEMDSQRASAIGKDLKEQLKCTREEIVMILNMVPITDATLEMMFPGRFAKEETLLLVSIINTHLGLPMPVAPKVTTLAAANKDEPMDEDRLEMGPGIKREILDD